MVDLYPPIEPYDHGLLDVGDGNRVYWEVCGNPDGKPALAVHGGPGSGCTTRMRQAFDRRRYRAVLFDQRGCGRSLPHASDPATDMSCNTTEHLIADMERLREHLGVERWLLHGGSWGSTLLLAYAERYPRRVSEIVIASVTMTRRSEIDWLYRGVGRFFREAWQRFRAVVPETVVSLEPGGKPNIYSDRRSEALLALVRICSHYFSNAAWLEEGVLLRNAGRLAGIPGVLIHGRLDLSGPADTAWELAQAWPDAELVILNDSGHQASDSKRERILSALDQFARR